MTGLTADGLYTVPDINYRSYGVTYDGQDDNLMNRNYFRFTIQRIPNFERFVRGVICPPFRFGEIIQPTTLNIDIRRPGGSFIFEPLQIDYAVDERFLSYLELFKWITSIGMIEDPITIPKENYTSDATLFITNSAYVPTFRVVFKDLYPISLGELDFTSAEPISGPLLTRVVFNYTKFEIFDANGSLCGTVLGN